MSPQTLRKPGLSEADYLAAERDAEVKHEYIDGELYAMTGASRRHALIVTALVLALGPHARRRGCQLFTGDLKLRLQLAGATIFYYPDLMVACDPTDQPDPYYLTRPCLVAEVLSPSTERIDRREKLLSYISLPSVQEVLLVAQDAPAVEIHRRRNAWQAEVHTDGALRLDCLDADLAVADVYADVAHLPPAQEGAAR
ncbi:Uma2 family endonuclease [Thiomonas sp.]|jgi:Uma2 family endonuclease|uniref:Uma2 family endonuclease n=1 Tax=Thiomonas sp. TaxID=2047785 RepID=UPI0026109FC9|nr:Uma2 family endonuclease [Thiomonas sp.]